MPTYVDPNKCDGCKGQERTVCMYICPNDLMKLDVEISKGFNQEPDLCWECYSCVKACPQSAIAMRGYGDVMPMGASLTPMRGTDTIMWTVKYRNGGVKRFKYAIRTTAWGSIDPFGALPAATSESLKTEALCNEGTMLGVDTLPVPQN